MSGLFNTSNNSGGGTFPDDRTEATFPVELDDVGVSLPDSEELRTTVSPRRSSSRRSVAQNNNSSSSNTKLSLKWIWIGSFLAVLLLVVVIPAVVLSRGSEDRSRPQVQDVIQYLINQDVSSAEAFAIEDSPQTKAVKWLAEDDPANIPIPSGNIVTINGYRYMFRYVMAVNYYAMGGQQWSKGAMNFLSGDDICDWGVRAQGWYYGVRCPLLDSVPRLVRFNDVGMVGEIPKENGKLFAQWIFELQFNEGVTGTIPEEFCSISGIGALAFAHTSLNGTIPPCFGDLNNMQALVLNDNLLTGPIPSELGRLNNLQQLWVQNNMLAGSLPNELGDASNLSRLFFDDNPSLTGNPLPVLNRLTNLYWIMGNDCDFEGEIDETFLADAKGINAIDLSHNNFTSSNGVPEHLFAKPILEVIDLSSNKLAGELPTEIPSDGAYRPLLFLGLYDNNLSGPLPEALMNLTGIDHMDLSLNNFDGPIPDFLGDMTALKFLFLSENDFDEGPIPGTFANLMNLVELSLRSTSRTGPLPDYIGVRPGLTNLELIDFGSNMLTGPIPESYGNLEDLEYLLLNQNADITGNIPDSFANLTSLKGLYVDGTGLEGALNVVCDLPNFDTLMGQEVIYADCGGSNPPIECRDSCGCTCCEESEGGCSEPLLGNFDASWENRFRRSNIREKYVFINDTEYFDSSQLPDGPEN